MVDPTPFLPGLSPVAGKSLTAHRDGGNLTSKGGLIVLRELGRHLNIASVIAAPLPDARNPLLITHTSAEMVTATISRLENLGCAKILERIGTGFIDLFCAGYSGPPHRIELDIDDTDDMVHGGQQLALANTHAGGPCFKPIHIFKAASCKTFVSLLRPGKLPTVEEIAEVLKPVIARIRSHCPKVRILIRGDGHYYAPEVLDLLRRLDCDYILGLPGNATLAAMSKPSREQCENHRRRHRPVVPRFHQFQYGAGSSARKEAMMARIEATALGSDARFVVTNRPRRGIHYYGRVYCALGKMENLINDMKLYTRSDKIACHRWEANQFRLFLHMGA